MRCSRRVLGTSCTLVKFDLCALLFQVRTSKYLLTVACHSVYEYEYPDSHSTSFVNSPNTPLCYVKETEMHYYIMCVVLIEPKFIHYNNRKSV